MKLYSPKRKTVDNHQKGILFIVKNDPDKSIANIIFKHFKIKLLRLKHDVVFFTAFRKTRRVIYFSC